MSVAVQGEADCMVPIIVCRSKVFSRVGVKKGIEIEKVSVLLVPS